MRRATDDRPQNILYTQRSSKHSCIIYGNGHQVEQPLPALATRCMQLLVVSEVVTFLHMGNMQVSMNKRQSSLVLNSPESYFQVYYGDETRSLIQICNRYIVGPVQFKKKLLAHFKAIRTFQAGCTHKKQQQKTNKQYDRKVPLL